MRHPRAWFLPENHDVLGTLRAQLDIVETVVTVLQEWCMGASDEQVVVQMRSLLATEHEVRRKLQTRFGPVSARPLPQRTCSNSANGWARSPSAPTVWRVKGDCLVLLQTRISAGKCR